MNTPTPQPNFAAVMRSIASDKQVGVTVAVLLVLTITSGVLDFINPMTTNHELVALLAMAAIVVCETTFSALTAITGRKVDGLRALTMLAIAVVLVIVMLAGTAPALPLIACLYVGAAVSVPWVAGYTMAVHGNKKVQERSQDASNAVVAPEMQFSGSAVHALSQQEEKVAA